MGGGASSPSPPDYRGLAQQQADINKQANLETTVTNRPTQIGIFGNVDWAMDPATGRWIQKESLDPRVQGLVDQSLTQANANQKGLTQLQNRGQFGGVGGAYLYSQSDPLREYDPNSGDQYANQYAQQINARTLPQQQRDREAMDVKLRLQGLQPGSEAYNRAAQQLYTAQGDVNANTQLEAMRQGRQESRDVYNTWLDSAMQKANNNRAGYITRMQGQQQMYDQAYKNWMNPFTVQGQIQDLSTGNFGAYLPSYQGYGTAQGSAGADMMGAAQQQYAQQVQLANEKNARRTGTGAAIGGAIGTAAGAYFGSGNPAAMQAGGAAGSAFGGWVASDEALKHNVEDISDEDAYHAMLRIRPHSFNWISTGARQSGLIAQEVQQFFPHLVRTGANGYLEVDYQTFTALLLGAFRHLAKLRS